MVATRSKTNMEGNFITKAQNPYNAHFVRIDGVTGHSDMIQELWVKMEALHKHHTAEIKTLRW